MELTGSITRRRVMLDKSALVRGADVDPAIGEPCLCAITRFEMLSSARSARAYEELETELDAFPELRMDAETIAIARVAQRELAAQAQHRVSIPDLLIASWPACSRSPRSGSRPELVSHLLSSSSVTGPSLTSSTCMWAQNTPRRAPRRSQNRSYSGSASSAAATAA